MRIHTHEVTCSICGETGVATARVAAAEWFVGNEIAHRDPRVCRDALRRQRDAAREQNSKEKS